MQSKIDKAKIFTTKRHISELHWSIKTALQKCNITHNTDRLYSKQPLGSMSNPIQVYFLHTQICWSTGDTSSKPAPLKWPSNVGCFCVKVPHLKVGIHSFCGREMKPGKSQSSSYMYVHMPPALGPLTRTSSMANYQEC